MVEVLTPDGHGSGVGIAGGVITNAHVVEGVSNVQVATYDGRTASATVVRLDHNADLALLQTSLAIPPLDMEFMGQQRQGDEVLVLGYPLDLRVGAGGQATLTRGLISGTGTEQGTGRALIQTDAAINPGNSGGAMVNMRGRLIGLPTFSLTNTQNVNFAIAMDTVNAFLGMPQTTVAPQPSMPKPTPTPRPTPPKYGAIAFDSGSGRWGDSYNYDDLGSAEAAALSGCGRPGCVIVQWVTGPYYIALATGTDGWGTSGAQPTQADAERNALASCSRYAFACTVAVSVHNAS